MLWQGPLAAAGIPRACYYTPLLRASPRGFPALLPTQSPMCTAHACCAGVSINASHTVLQAQPEHHRSDSFARPLHLEGRHSRLKQQLLVHKNEIISAAHAEQPYTQYPVATSSRQQPCMHGIAAISAFEALCSSTRNDSLFTGRAPRAYTTGTLMLQPSVHITSSMRVWHLPQHKTCQQPPHSSADTINTPPTVACGTAA
jgi:hypothetical protein